MCRLIYLSYVLPKWYFRKQILMKLKPKGLIFEHTSTRQGRLYFCYYLPFGLSTKLCVHEILLSLNSGFGHPPFIP